MAKTLKQHEVLELMRKKQGAKTNTEFAVELGISKQYLSDIYLGKREISETVAAALGLEREMVFHA